jgi:starch-binding outer membrane protein, SusD/RagB family
MNVQTERFTGFTKGRTARRGGLLALALAVSLSACDSLMDVENPNQLVESDLGNPTAAAALVNGALATVATAHADMMTIHGTASDELKWVGSRDAWRELAFGFLTDPRNEFSDAAYPQVARGRWMADEAIRRLEAFDAEGELANRTLLARARLYSAISYTTIADLFDDFTFGNMREEGPPVGADNMVQLYDQAIANLTAALGIAGISATLERDLLAQRARTRHARAVWLTLNPAGSVPADPLVNDAGANDDALAALAASTDLDWAFRFAYSSATVTNGWGAWINERLEMRVGDPYIVPDATDKQVDGILLEDPIDNIPDPALEAIVMEAVGARQFGPITVVSAREMHLILAEAALAAGEPGDFEDHINAVRSLDELTDYTGQIPALDMLRHARRVNLFNQGRRLADHYRFGEPSVEWAPNSSAVQTVGTFLPITEIERTANCYILGTC